MSNKSLQSSVALDWSTPAVGMSNKPLQSSVALDWSTPAVGMSNKPLQSSVALDWSTPAAGMSTSINPDSQTGGPTGGVGMVAAPTPIEGIWNIVLTGRSMS